MKTPMPRPTKDKSRIEKYARAVGRKVLWKDKDGYWHAATNRLHTPGYAVETEDLESRT